MSKKIRTKPCSNCKKSKVKCEYEKTLPCTRCLNAGLSSSCHFEFRLPSLNFPQIGSSSINGSFERPGNVPHIVARPSETIFNTHSSSQAPSESHSSKFSHSIPITLSTSIPPLTSTSIPASKESVSPDSRESMKTMRESDVEWRSSMESKLESVDAKFNDILNVLKANNNALERDKTWQSGNENSGNAEQEVESIVTEASFNHSSTASKGVRKRQLPEGESTTASKRPRFGPEDFRDNVIDIDEASILFKFFDENIAQQLFGFEIKKFKVNVLWESSPILVCAICTIASMHYSGQAIATKQSSLHKHLRELCANVLFMGRPQTEQEAFYTIVSLVLCSFWLSDSQMFTGIALQLAKDFNLNRPRRLEPETESSLSDSDRLKLWYLLFILDGQQSITLHRQALVSSDDYTLQNPRKMLIDRKHHKPEANANKIDTPNSVSPDEDKHMRTSEGYERLTDLRLVSQVEYNTALSESFKGNAWDLLAPQSFGIPSRSNLELDKWMVSWTVLLAPMNNGGVWSSKSTLIYYNFAKMHINSSVIRQLQGDRSGGRILLPNWKKYEASNDHLRSTSVTEKHGNSTTTNNDGSDSDDEFTDMDDAFVSNSELVTQDQALVSHNIAVNAAQTVLNLVLSDQDISNHLKYVPVHIHMMLYYAAILLVSPPALVQEKDTETPTYFYDIIAKLKTVRLLQNKVHSNFPTDRSFGDELIKNLDNLIEERIANIMFELHACSLSVSNKAVLINEVAGLHYTSYAHLSSSISSGSSDQKTARKQERISAWPGSHHGHP